MECPFCGKPTKVIKKRKTEGGRHYRRRECRHCKERFTTYEVNQAHLLDLLEDHLPMRLVDEISHTLAFGYPEKEKDKDLME